MERFPSLEVFFLLGVLFVQSSGCLPTVTTVICDSSNDVFVGSTSENYEGDVEIVEGISPGESLTLDNHIFPGALEFLQITHPPGTTTANITTIKPLDADVIGGDGTLYYKLKCQSGRESFRRLKVEDINDNAPVFQQREYTATISETTAVGTVILTVLAIDADVTDANNRVTYSIKEPSQSVFGLTLDGRVQLKERLNYNTGHSFTLILEAKDPGGRTGNATVLITVTDFDNLNPYFNHTLYEASIPENQDGVLPSIEPEAIKALDGDTGINQPVVYGITSVSPSKYRDNFDIDVNTGVLSVKTAIDREDISTVNVQIQAAQTDDASKTANALVVVTIEDVNDNPPEFDKDEYSSAILENSPAGSYVLQVKVTDKDEGGFSGTIRIIPESVPFAVSQEGVITVKTSAALDREATEHFLFQVEAREDDAPNDIVTANVNITLLDVNDNSPMFDSINYKGKVYRNQTEGMLVVKVEATDPDEGANGNVTYSIDGGNQEGYFTLNPVSGEITLAKLIPLEENKILRFSLYVTARDGGERPLASSVPVDIQAPGDSRPHFLQSIYQAEVEEERDAPVEILKVGFVSISSVAELRVETEGDIFSIDNNGMLSTKIKLDHETKANYSIQLSLSDGASRDEAVVEIQVKDINDNRPVFTVNPVNVTLPEDTLVGEEITTVTATDLDVGYNGKVRYSLLGGGGNFLVDGDTGKISVAKSLDREEQDEISMEVVAIDQGRPALSATASVFITLSDVNDNAPVFSPTQYFLTISEVDEPGLGLANLTATDKDIGQNAEILYGIAKQDPATEAPVFVLDSLTGALSLARKVDYREGKEYALVVEAVDGGTPRQTGSAMVRVQVIDVNNNAPEFSKKQYDVSVPENLAGGAVVVSLEVTDNDKEGFSNGYFNMTSDTFSINKMGAISLLTDVTLDREKQDRYILQVVAVDQPVDGLSATAHVYINVTDVNDNNPKFLPFPSPAPIAEGNYSIVKPGVVCKIEAEDEDIGDNGRVNISFTPYEDIFTLQEDGNLVALVELDRERQAVYDLVLIATDHGTPQRQTNAKLRVTVTDVNDNAPVFSLESYSKSILANDSKAEDVVLTVTATDKDIGKNAIITYSFASEPSEYLKLNNETGEITLTSDLTDVTKDMVLDMKVRAQDHGTPPLSDTAAVLIYIRTVTLEEGLVFSRPTYNFSVQEHKSKGEQVGTVMAYSGSSLYEVSYTLKTHTDIFSVDKSGSIVTLAELDKEELEFYAISVEATDTRVPPSAAVALVTVQVDNVNERPVFEGDYRAEVFSIAPFKYPVVKVKATDPDIGETERLRYSLVEPSSVFDVEPSSGLVYVVSVSGMEGTMSVRVKAEDPHGLSAETAVEVSIRRSEDDNVVVFSLNQPINTVEKKTSELEKSLGSVLGWTVRVIGVTTGNGGTSVQRSVSRSETRTYISLVAVDTSGTLVNAETIRDKMKTEENKVQAELQKVFGPDLDFDVEKGPGESGLDSSQTAIIVLGVLLALSILGLVVLLVVSVLKFRRLNGDMDSDKESFDMSQNSLRSHTDPPSDIKEVRGASKDSERRDSAQDSVRRSSTDTDRRDSTDPARL